MPSSYDSSSDLTILIIFVVIVYLVLCGIAAYLSSRKGYNGVAFFFISLILSPLFSLLIISCLPDKELNSKIDRLLDNRAFNIIKQMKEQ